MKFGQLIEYNMRKICLEKSYTECGGEFSFRPISGKLKFSNLWINSLKFYAVFF